MDIIDIHAHLRIREGESSLEACLKDMQSNKISKRVISTFEGDSIKDGINIIVDAVKKYPEQLIGCAVINPTLSSCMEDVSYALRHDEIKCIEFNSFEHGFYPDTDIRLESILEYIAQHRPTTVIKAFTGLGAKSLPHQWEIQAKKYPQLNFVLLHIGCFDYGYGCVDVVARNKNIFTETSNQYELQILKKAFNELTDDKLFFGTTYPSRLTSSGIQIFDLYDLNDEKRDSIFNKNAKRLFNV